MNKLYTKDTLTKVFVKTGGGRGLDKCGVMWYDNKARRAARDLLNITAECSRLLLGQRKKHTEGCQSGKSPIFGHSAQMCGPKCRECADWHPKNFTDCLKNGQNCQVFGHVAILRGEFQVKFYEIHNEKILQSCLKYVIIHKSDMR